MIWIDIKNDDYIKLMDGKSYDSYREAMWDLILHDVHDDIPDEKLDDAVKVLHRAWVSALDRMRAVEFPGTEWGIDDGAIYYDPEVYPEAVGLAHAIDRMWPAFEAKAYDEVVPEFTYSTF